MRDRLFYADEAAELVGRKPSTIRWWVHRGYLHAFCVDSKGRQLYLDRHVFEAERETRRRAHRRVAGQGGQRGSNMPFRSVVNCAHENIEQQPEAG